MHACMRNRCAAGCLSGTEGVPELQVEILNPAETFGDIMVDYSYVECSSACITALCAFRRRHPEYRTHDILNALGRGKEFIQSIQRPDGSWCAVCHEVSPVLIPFVSRH
jgi:squalene cyclase